MPRALVGLLLALTLLAPRALLAKPTPLSTVRSDDYYYLHGGLTLAGFAGTLIEDLATVHHGAGYDLTSFGPDDVVRQSFSASAAHLSDKLLLFTVATPLFLQMSQGFETSMGNASLIYAETLALNLFVNESVKLIVRRPRPYTHSRDPRVVAFFDRQGADAFTSFYSAHASMAHTGAMAGSLLFAARTDELVARHVVWGTQFLLAGMTAQLRVRAGRHYRTDIWVGTAVGLGAGLLVPALHGVDLSRVRGTEIATAAGTLGVTMLLSEVVDFCSALDTLHLCALPRDIDVPLRDATDLVPSWAFSPTVLPGGGGGLAVIGEL